MKTKIALVAGVILAGLVAVALLTKRQAARETQAAQSRGESNRAVSSSSAPLLRWSAAASDTLRRTNSAVLTQPASPPPASTVRQTALPSRSISSRPASASKKEPAQDPVARVALAFVGMDADAEAYWFDAINDPTLPANERKNLIEDLNEDGLSDAKNPGPEDLPVILNRMKLIEELSPYAMDQVNADAFKEAYKDLLNLANHTIGGGEPVN